MKIIKEIRIHRYRSILNTTRGGVNLSANHLNIIVGSNDAGKSNFLKALNLFFNHGKHGDFDFWKNYSIQRYGKQKETNEIIIELIITPPEQQNFRHDGDIRWIKRWVPNSLQPEEDISYISGAELNRDNRSMIFKWLKRIEFIYVPAIKSDDYFNRLILSLYDILDEDTTELESSFNDKLQGQTRIISEEINRRLGIKSFLQFTGTFRDLFNRMEFGGDEKGGIMMNQRGDGIKVRHIPVILQAIAEAKLLKRRPRDPRVNTIWGFEEPENHLEFSSARNLADNFLEYKNRICFQDERQKQFDEGIQIFLSTHSPVFYTLSNVDQDSVNTFFASKREDDSTEIRSVPKDRKGRLELEERMELEPLVALSAKWEEVYGHVSSLSEKIENLNERLSEIRRPVVLTEGKTDSMILITAWNKLFGDQSIPFDIIPGDTSDPNNPETTNASASTLGYFFRATRHVDSLRIVLWDNDQEGNKVFKSCKNSSEYDGLSYVKVHDNGRSFGVLLPPHDDLKQFVQAKNMPIEFYFDQSDYLKRDMHGRGLKLEGIKISKQMGDLSPSYQFEEPWFSYIRGDKVAFAENIVPTLPRESFKRFRKLFDLLLDIVRDNEVPE